MAISLLDEETDEVAAFEELIASHGGIGGPQTQPLILHPADWRLDEPLIGAESLYRQIRRWLDGVGIDLSKAARETPSTTPASPGASPAATTAGEEEVTRRAPRRGRSTRRPWSTTAHRPSAAARPPRRAPPRGARPRPS